MSPAEAVKLLALAEPDELVRELDQLATPLGVPAGEIEHLRSLDDGQLVVQLKALSKEQRAGRRAVRVRRAVERAEQTAQELSVTATWKGDRLVLAPEWLLRDLPAHPTARHLGFVTGDLEPIYVTKNRLRKARKPLSVFTDLQAYLDRRGLHFRWHDGRGGLDLFPQPVPANQTDLFLVHLPEKTEPVPATSPSRRHVPGPERVRRGGAWLGEVLGDLGLLL